MMVEDVNRTVAFYRDVLGFELVVGAPARGAFRWALIRHGDVEMMFQACDSLAAAVPVVREPGPAGALTFYIDTDDVMGLYEQVRARVTVVQDVHTTCYGTCEFSIKDCNGFILTFAQEVKGPPAVSGGPAFEETAAAVGCRRSRSAPPAFSKQVEP